MVGVILAAGDGKRLKDSRNDNCCKPLIKLNGKHLIIYALDNLVQLKISEAYIVIGKEGAEIKNTIGNEYDGIKIHYVCQQEQIGLVNALVQALKVIDCDETVILQLSDEIFIDLDFKSIQNALEITAFDFYCGITPEENEEKIRNNFSVETDNESLIIKCTEKPKVVINNIKGTGFTIFSGKAQKIIKEIYESESGKLYDLCDCFNYLAANHRGLAFSVAKKEFNINTVSDLIEAERFLTNNLY